MAETEMRRTPQSTDEVQSNLNVESLTVRYGDKTALDALSFHTEPGAIISILGPSGCGKSTLLRSIAGLTAIADGQISIGAEDITRTAPAKRGVAFVFQTYALYPHLNVY